MSDHDSDDDDDDGPKLIRPPNRIKDKVSMGGRIQDGSMDEDLLKRAETRAEGMNDTFLEAASEDIARLQAACKAAEKEPAKAQAHLAGVLAAAHELKSYGKTIGFDLITQFAHSLAAFLRQTKAPPEKQVPIARVHVDAIRLVFHQKIKGDGGEIGTELAKGLSQAIAKYTG